MISIEQIEYLRSKGNISYEEAKHLLEKYDGDVVKALCELEKRGKLSNNKKEESTFMDSLKELFRKGNENRLLIKRKNDVIANFSINYTIVFIIMAAPLALVSIILVLILGYKIKFKKENHGDYDMNDFVDKATSNVKNSVKSMVEEEEVNETKKTQTNEKDGYSEITIE
ncbi:MAG: DUF4342 domain-containing protein [Eubacteriales bacterium]